MMRTKHLFPIVLTALTFGACSDDNVAPGGENKGASWNSEGKGYVTLAINLPTEKASRANDNFDDGLSSEYQVNNATLILFAGNDEANSTFHSAYKLDRGNWNGTGTDKDQITTSTKIVQQINQIDASNIYALVILNDNGLLTVGEDGSLEINNSPIASATKWSEFNSALTGLTNSFFTSEGLIMTNAPLTVAQGEDIRPEGTVFTLADVDESKIFGSYAESSNHPAASIYVERAVAKVTVNKGSIVDGGTTTGGGNQQYTIEGWCLDQTNTKSYLVRNVGTNPNWLTYKSGGSTDYRFVGGNAVDSKYYRTYWGEDPNYTTTETDDLTKITVADAEFKTNFGTDYPTYCLENTFNVDTQDKDKTTRVIVKAKFNDGRDFYLQNRDESTLYEETTMKGLFKSTFLKEPTIKDWLEANTASGQTVGEGDLTLTFDEVEQSKGIMKLKDVTIANGKLKADAEPKPENAMNLTNEAVGTVNYYKGGIAYYSVLIRHFDDTQTPWNSGKPWEDPKPSATDIYPGSNAEQNYLGRYGVLRNNWYDLTINSIKSIGDPDIPTVDGKDDDLNAYISVTINILSWAKRTQDVDL